VMPPTATTPSTAAQSLTVGGPPITAVTHPTSTTTVTTTTVRTTPTTLVTTVTTTTVHPTTTTTPASTTTTTTETTTTTTTPSASANGILPDAPASLGAPSSLALDDEFNTGALNQSLWAPLWWNNGATQNGTVMDSSNVSVGSNGLALNLAANGTGGLVSSNPADDVAGHTGFQIAPTAGHPVYVEFKATLPASSNGEVANWPALWLVGQTWPQDGEIDVMEGLTGTAAFHIHYGSGSSTAQGGAANSSPGTHTYGVLWTTTGVTFVYDGAVVGTLTEALTQPMFLVMENSLGVSQFAVEPATLDVRYVRVWS
jgi:hypothetical protein